MEIHRIPVMVRKNYFFLRCLKMDFTGVNHIISPTPKWTSLAWITLFPLLQNGLHWFESWCVKKKTLHKILDVGDRKWWWTLFWMTNRTVPGDLDCIWRIHQLNGAFGAPSLSKRSLWDVWSWTDWLLAVGIDNIQEIRIVIFVSILSKSYTTQLS